jgi:hypothetical protein
LKVIANLGGQDRSRRGKPCHADVIRMSKCCHAGEKQEYDKRGAKLTKPT